MRRFLMALVLSFLAGGVVTQAEAQTGLLWEISGNGLEEPSFVFGTMHVIPGDSFFIPEGMGQSIAKASLLVLEVDPDIDMGQIMGQMGSMMMKGDTSLDDFLTEEEYEEVEAYMETYTEVPKFMWRKMYPVFLEQMIPSGRCEETHLYDKGTFSYESYLTDIFRDLEREIGSLETVESQLGIFSSVPLEEQVRNLMDVVQAGDENCDLISRLIHSYRLQDLSTLEQILLQDNSIGGFSEAFLYRRNRDWIPVMKEMMDTQSVFFAVGAGHLPGEEGVLKLLESQGYTVRNIEKP